MSSPMTVTFLTRSQTKRLNWNTKALHVMTEITLFSKKLKQENEKYIARKYENTMREIRRIEGIIEQQKQWNRERNIRTAESKQKMVDRLKDTLVIPQEELANIRPKFSIKDGRKRRFNSIGRVKRL